MSLHSSGVDASAHDVNEHCLACDWEGFTEAIIDRETNLYTWTCPACTTTHEQAWV